MALRIAGGLAGVQFEEFVWFLAQNARNRPNCPLASVRFSQAARDLALVGAGIGVAGAFQRARREHALVALFRGAETHARSVMKAISWRTLGTLDTFAISWFMTGRPEIAGSIAGIEIVTKIAWYYLHERIWASVHWGRR